LTDVKEPDSGYDEDERSAVSLRIQQPQGEKWEVESGKWEVGSGKWEVGSGKSEVGTQNSDNFLGS